MKKLILTLVLCAVPTLALATYLPIPKLKPKPAVVEAQMSCLDRLANYCARKHRMTLLRNACVRIRVYRCR